MRRYGKKDIKDIKWVKYKIVVPTENDRKELMDAFRHIHDSDIDTEYVAVNQLAHEYLSPDVTGDSRNINNIIIDKKLFEQL